MAFIDFTLPKALVDALFMDRKAVRSGARIVLANLFYTFYGFRRFFNLGGLCFQLIPIFRYTHNQTSQTSRFNALLLHGLRHSWRPANLIACLANNNRLMIRRKIPPTIIRTEAGTVPHLIRSIILRPPCPSLSSWLDQHRAIRFHMF